MIALAMVFVIDDDAPVRKSLKRLLDAADYQVELFESAADFLARPPFQGASCVIVDVRMPGLSGIDLQKALVQRRRQEQLVFLTGHGDIPMCAQAMKAGAVDFLPKPFESKNLLDCVERALARSNEQRRQAAEKNERPRVARFANAARVRSDAALDHRDAQQAGGGRARDHRKDSEVSSRPSDAQAGRYAR